MQFPMLRFGNTRSPNRHAVVASNRADPALVQKFEIDSSAENTVILSRNHQRASQIRLA